MLFYFYVFISALVISLLWSLCWYLLVSTMLFKQFNKRRCAAYCTAFCVLQIIYNFFLVEYIVYQPIDIKLVEATNYAVQALVMLPFLHVSGQKDLFKNASAVALAYFFGHNTYYTINAALAAPILSLTGSDSLFLAFWGICIPYFILLPFVTLMVLLLRKINFRHYFSHLFTGRVKPIVTCAVCVFVMFSYRLILWVSPTWAETKSYTYANFFGTFAIVLVLLFLAVFETNRARLKTREAELLQQKAYVQSLEHIQGEVRAYRHDYQNMMAGLYLQAQQGDISGVQKFLRGTLEYFDGHIAEEIRQTTSLARVKVPEVKSLLIVKLMQLQQQGIQAGLEVTGEVIQTGMETEDFTRCLGILMDNAAEAAMMAEKKQVSIVLLSEPEALHLVVKNTFAKKPELHELNQTGYTTKGRGRGTGLGSYRAILRRYTNAIAHTVVEKDLFVQELVVQRGQTG